MKETELAKKFIEYLSDFDLYFEVKVVSNIVDIVCVKKPLKMAIEVKTSFNLSVIEQALNNKDFFHYSYVAVPKSKRKMYGRNDSQSMALRICKDYGIGVLTCDHNDVISERIKPQLNRNAMVNYVNEQEYNKKSIPGSVNDRMTAFKYMILNIVEYLKRNDGAKFEDVWDNCVITYRTLSAFKGCMYGWCNKGIIKEFYVKKSRLYLNNK